MPRLKHVIVTKKLLSGVPQGSVLGLLVFNLYMAVSLELTTISSDIIM